MDYRYAVAWQRSTDTLDAAGMSSLQLNRISSGRDAVPRPAFQVFHLASDPLRQLLAALLLVSQESAKLDNESYRIPPIGHNMERACVRIFGMQGAQREREHNGQSTVFVK